ncbi:nucleostemin 4 isoform X1 [Arctopsyche grandis]|uniref:nucleostemin 4 isoform X1 n=1 Tax=Arctopsyche grandis TaxID=121162 RepID=UPI00406D651A
MPRKKVPFSGKAKRQQLQKKKMGKNSNYLMTRAKESSEEDGQDITRSYIHKGQTNRYALKLNRETDAEVEEKKELAKKQIIRLDETCLEITSDKYFPAGLTFPRRPPWNFDMSRLELDSRENRYFTQYLSELHKTFEKGDSISIDRNIENWRQLWRVTEMSDILLLVVDIRFPNLIFPPSLYDYVVGYLHKHMVVVLNKIDLAPPSLVAAWKHYFTKQYPKLKIVLFTSFPSYNLRDGGGSASGIKIKRRKGKQKMAAEGAQKLQEACQTLVKDELDLSLWKHKILEEMNFEYEDIVIDKVVNQNEDTSYFQHQRFKEGILTIGCVGQPNVGKSSLINALMGRKVVSVSRTPGHTKHFQTIFLTSNVRLCDCPGLVFPSTVSKVLQVLMGSFPIAQLREPYTTIKYLAERMDLVKLLKITHPSKEEEWSAMDICEAWATKRGFFTAKAARPDTHRASNHLLRMALSGQISLCFMPPGYVAEKSRWEQCDDIEYIKWVQANIDEVPTNPRDSVYSDDEDEDSSEDDHGESGSKEESTSDDEDPGSDTKVKNRFDLLDVTSSD